MKSRSLFYPDAVLERVARNIREHKYASDMRDTILTEVKPWLRFSDEELRKLVFGPTLSRSNHVWSSGHCPACKADVPMRTWVFKPFEHPWKAGCPHCCERFPKNDFYKYYLSGLDDEGIFRREAADALLLYNTEHPDPADPLHLYGVDDGEGYVDPVNGNRWYFIATYLLQSQWKTLIVDGMEKLANAYVVTGDAAYARKVALLFDRIADLYPTFNFKEQGYCYEKRGNHAGYVGNHYDTNFELCSTILSYDKVFEGIKRDKELPALVGKRSFEEVQRHIESRIFRHAIANRPKLVLNFPATDTLVLLMRAVVDWEDPAQKADILTVLTELLQRATAVDGVTGEKGLANYSALVIHKTSEVLALFQLADDRFLEDLVGKLPQLRDTYKFFIDTWIMENYYPLTGDTGSFAAPTPYYRGVRFENTPRLSGIVETKISTEPSMYTHIWNVYKLTGDTNYVKVMYKNNGYSLDRFPYDLTAPDPGQMREQVTEIIRRDGKELRIGSVNKEQWHLAILRSGQGERESAVWLDYDSGFSHGHRDGMNLGLFAKGLDLMPDFGYVPIQYDNRSWYSVYTLWYTSTAAHNTVAIDGQSDIRGTAGQTTLWAAGERFKAIRASGKEIVDKDQFERTIVLADISADDVYVLDIFRVAGGQDHAKFMGSHFGKITTSGLTLQPAEDYGYDTLMRNFKGELKPQTGWSVDWEVHDYLELLKKKRDIHLKYTDLTFGAAAYTAEAWVSARGTAFKDEKWIPRVMVRRQAGNDTALTSAFVAVIEPYEGKSNIVGIKRLALTYEDGGHAPDGDAAVEVQLADGRLDLHVSLDTEDPFGMKEGVDAGNGWVQPEWGLASDSELLFVRKGKSGAVERIALCKGSFMTLGSVELQLNGKTDFIEMVFEPGKAPSIVSGRPESVVSLSGF